MLEAFQRLINRDDRRTEADIQADVRQFLLSAPFELTDGDLSEIPMLESPLGDRRRIDIEAGSTVIEVKRDLRKARALHDAEIQLAGYVRTRVQQTEMRYVGVITDGAEWHCYHLVDDQLVQVSSFPMGGSDANVSRLVVWLEGVLATTQHISPTVENIEQRLGATSSAYALDKATLSTLYAQNRNNPTVQVKRMLWSRLLISALGTQFEDTDELFIDHTLLVNTSEVIAHAVLGLSVEHLPPPSLLTGTKFDEAGVYGVVESDFFDWVIEVDGGDTFVRSLARRLARFTWGAVEQDVLKVLYENFIGQETRKKLGEYYTPDWLAEAVVRELEGSPLSSRVMDPACGSGTFLFHAIRRYIRASEESGEDTQKMLAGLTSHIIGMDLHPVAVTLARVTYLLAIGRERLMAPNRGVIQIPVYLGDSIQWREQDLDLWSAGNLVIRTNDRRDLFESELTFPDAIIENAVQFDQLVIELAERSSKRKAGSPTPSLKAIFSRLSIPQEHWPLIEGTFATMCRLHDEGRDHIWGYYVRNLARPLWFSRPQNRVDALIGNPPWLAYRHMTVDMQVAFKAMSKQRDLWSGAKVATSQDLSALFAIRACELYLRQGGQFAFVMPNTVLDRDHYSGFRVGVYNGPSGVLALRFQTSWDLRRVRPHIFPRAACVVYGSRGEYAEHSEGDVVPDNRAMPSEMISWTGKLKVVNAPWESASKFLSKNSGQARVNSGSSASPYARIFTQGATLVPRVAFIVHEEEVSSSLGLAYGQLRVRSFRSVQEKKPWNKLPDLSGVVESEFVRPYFTGDNLRPYSLGKPLLAVIPASQNALLSQDSIESHSGLRQWIKNATELWEAHRTSDRLSLLQRLDYQGTLSKQLPISPLRVVYNRAGMHVVSSKLLDRRALVANGLYWAPVSSEEEADYICSVLNAPITTELTRPLMSYGKDERDIHKHVWSLPIPKFDSSDEVHRRLSLLGAEMHRAMSAHEVNHSIHFSATRRHLRAALAESPEGREIEHLVRALLSQ